MTERDPKSALGSSWGPSWTLLGPFWRLLGPFWALGPLWDPFRPSLVHFGPKSDAQASNMLIFDQKRSTGVANGDFLMKIHNFGPKSDAQASNMLILDQQALDRHRKQ